MYCTYRHVRSGSGVLRNGRCLRGVQVAEERRRDRARYHHVNHAGNILYREEWKGWRASREEETEGERKRGEGGREVGRDVGR